MKWELCCGLAQERIFEDLCKVLNEEIHLLIHSFSNYEVPNYVLSLVLCFEKEW